jgi:hypothetical protein
MKNVIACLVALMLVARASAAELKVNLAATDPRKDLLMPHWDNWRWKDAKFGSQKFGDVTVGFEGVNGSTLSIVWYKGLIEYGMHMGICGLAVKDANSDGQIVMTISGLSPGKHTVATYHNEPRDVAAAKIDVFVNDQRVVQGFATSKRADSDYDIASTYLDVTAEEGKDVKIRFAPSDDSPNKSLVISGFEIDTVNPARKAIKPLPQDDDEHIDPDAPLTWTAPAGVKLQQVYLGTDSAAVAAATPKSPEYKGEVTDAKFPLPKLDLMATYFWRIDEVVNGDPTPIKGEIWRFRPRFLAFPTAEGYGRFARGGRGGRVIEVTNLQDNDEGEPPIPGSYRAAIEAEGPRTIVFRVSGVIFLKRPCIVRNPFCTIAGQTAPGDGICLANYSAGLGSHDVIARFIRVRVGDSSKRAMDGMGLGNSDDSIIDHCTISWAMDEGSSSRGGRNITFQWNIISEMLQHAYHYSAEDRTKFETHAFAGSISGNIGSYHHNLLAHCTDRNWSLAGGLDQAGKYAGRLDIRNNVVYNWTARTTDGGVKDLNYVNNYYKPYPQQPRFVKWLLMLDPINDGWGAERVFMTGNVMEGFNYDNDNWSSYNQNPREKRSRDALIKLVRVDEPIFPSYVKDETARDAYQRVLAGAGAILPKRDPIDTRIVDEVRNGTVHYTGHKAAEWGPGNKNSPNVPGIIDTQTDVKDCPKSPNFPWPDYKTANVPVDSDHDGIPDDWEIKVGLNPKDPNDANADCNGDGYTNLEKYLNWLAGEYPMPTAKK